MTERDKLAIYEERLEIYNRDGGMCQYCGEPVGINEFQVAHRIANCVAMIKKYGKGVIDHPLNKATTHAGKCNDGVLITFNPVKREKLADEIRDQLLKE